MGGGVLMKGSLGNWDKKTPVLIYGKCIVAYSMRTACRLWGAGSCRIVHPVRGRAALSPQGMILDLLDTHKTAPHKNTWAVGGTTAGPWVSFGWVDNETDRNWMTHSFEPGWSESSTDAELTFHRRSPLDTVTKTSSGPHLPLLQFPFD